MKADEILTQGAEKIAGGWCRRAFTKTLIRQTSDGNAVELSDGYCAMGAMRKAAFGDANFIPTTEMREYYRAEHALAEVMCEQFNPPGVWQDRPFSVIACVNDYRAQSKDEIIACMEKAAANLRGAV